MDKYLDTAKAKTSTKFYKITFTSDMIFTKMDASTSDEQVEKLTRELNIHYRACIGSFIYLLFTIADLSFFVHKLAEFSSNPGKLHFEVLIHLLRYIRNINNLGLNYCADMKDAPLPKLLRKAIINTENQLMSFYDFSSNIFQTLAEVQEHILCFIKVFQWTMEHMFQDQFLNKLQKVSTSKNVLQVWIWKISGC